MYRSREAMGSGRTGPWVVGVWNDPERIKLDSVRHKRPAEAADNLTPLFSELLPVPLELDDDDEHIAGDERYDDYDPPELYEDEANPKPTGIERSMSIDWMQDGTFTRFNDIDESEA